jgi:OmpA-OmpF porin, OOP family
VAVTPESGAILGLVGKVLSDHKNISAEITGYADASGEPDEGRATSENRAKAVKNFLVGLGLDSGRLRISARGSSDLRVPTAAGVREPQNRRVEIVLE